MEYQEVEQYVIEQTKKYLEFRKIEKDIFRKIALYARQEGYEPEGVILDKIINGPDDGDTISIDEYFTEFVQIMDKDIALPENMEKIYQLIFKTIWNPDN